MLLVSFVSVSVGLACCDTWKGDFQREFRIRRSQTE